jgi:hypothetical protein
MKVKVVIAEIGYDPATDSVGPTGRISRNGEKFHYPNDEETK